MHSARFLFAALALAGGLFGCATSPKPGEFSAKELYAAACPAIAGKTVAGSIWTKIRSEELNGQFPATVRVDFPTRLAVEVTNLIGAPQAWLQMENGRTDLRLSAQNAKKYGKDAPIRNMLGGLPLEHAPRLFAGGVPCPATGAGVRMELDGEGGLIVEGADPRTKISTRYVYRFDRHAGKPWVRETEVRTETYGVVVIQREEPFGADSAPKRWSASSQRGEIQVRWKDRDLLQ